MHNETISFLFTYFRIENQKIKRLSGLGSAGEGAPESWALRSQRRDAQCSPTRSFGVLDDHGDPVV